MNRKQIERLRQIGQRWRLVLAVTVLAVVTATLYSLVLVHPTYVGKSTLMLSGRAPDQDAVTVLGYVSIFNDSATIARLSTAGKFPAGVTFEARTAAASPILVVEATAGRANAAQDAAEKMAQTFRADINSAQESGKDGYVADLEKQLTRIPAMTAAGEPNSYYETVQERINDVRADVTNQLQVLQPQAGVDERAPNVVYNIALGAIGGFLLGSLTALGIASLSTRSSKSADLKVEPGVEPEPLTELPANGSDQLGMLRGDRLRRHAR